MSTDATPTAGRPDHSGVVPHAQLRSCSVRFAASLVAALLCSALFVLVDWPELLPRAPRGLLAALVPGVAVVIVSAALRSRRFLGAHRTAPAAAAAALVCVLVSLATGGRVRATVLVAAVLLAYVSILMAAGRRPYDGAHRLEGAAIVYAACAVLLTVIPLGDDLARLDFASQVTLVLGLLPPSAALSLVAGQGWRPSRPTATALIGAVLLTAALLLGLGAEALDPADWLAVPGLALVLGGTLLGDHGRPAASHRRVSAVAMVLSLIAAIGVLVYHGTTEGSSHGVAEALGLIVVLVAFARAATPPGRDARTDPSMPGGTDRLTGLPDRYELEVVLERELAFAARRNVPVGLAVVDLVDLHEINETLGHRVGDEVLREFANRLSLHTGTDVPGRLAGGAFAVVLRAHGSERDARRILDGLITRVEAPLQVDDVALASQVRCGLAFFPAHGQTGGELLQRAEIAAQEAKDTGQSLLVYDPSRDRRSREQLIFAAQLREGIERDELRVFFQPKIDLATGLATGAEALVRWQHPDLGLLTPDRFLAVAERTGQMTQLTTWVLTAALREVQRWRAAGYALTVAVNLSPQNLVDATLPGRLEGLLTRHGLPGSWLELEITEDMAMADPARTAGVIKAINALGIGFSLDDFGTGYSSLAHLKYLNCDELKIDRSFVRDIASDEDDRVIVWSILDLARSLGMRTVAEGIESPDVVEMLAMMGCSVGQGFHYAVPLDADAFLRWCDTCRADGTIRLMQQVGVRHPTDGEPGPDPAGESRTGATGDD